MRVSAPLERPVAGSRRALAVLSLLIVLLIGTTLLPWQRAVATTSAPAPVKVARATTGTLKASVSLSGELRATDQIDVAARLSARVTRVVANVGQAVKAGEVLVELDSSQPALAVAQARASLEKEKIALARLIGPRAEEIAKEEANVRAVELKLAQVMQGARGEDIDSAVQKVNQARDTRSKTASQLSLAKEQARIALEQAAIALEAAQATYGAAKLVYDEAVRTGRDPNVACPASNRNCNELTDIRLRQYKATFETAELNMRGAEQALESRRLAYEDARQQEIAGLRIEAAKVLDTQASLDKLRNGPDRDAVARAQADLEAARASLAKLSSPTELDLQTARANVNSAEAAVRLAELNLAEARVVAPFNGIVTQRLVSVGSIVGSGTAVVQLVSETIEVRVNADDSQIATLAAGQPAEIRVNAYPGVVFNGRIDNISPSANLSSRTFLVTLTPEKVDARLRSGMLAQADVAAISRDNVLMIPEAAILARGAETTVFVVADGKARRKVVVLGTRGGGMSEVMSGLQAGEVVVIDGLAALNDNDQVTVVS